MAKIRIAVLGCGRVFPKHFQSIMAFKERLDWVGLCDTDLKALENAIQMTGNSVPGFRDLSQMLESTKPDLVSILTPSGYHAKHAIQIARSGCNVLVEKPMALTLADADEMIRACDLAGVKLFVVKQNRFNTPVQKVRQAFEAGRFGKIHLLTVRVRWCRDQAYYDSAAWRGTWALDGGVLANQAAHHVDILQWFGGEVLSTFAMAGTYGVRIEAEDTAASVLKFRTGAIGMIEATTAVRPKNLEGSFSMIGERGSVVIGGLAMNRIDEWAFVDSSSEEIRAARGTADEIENVYGNGHVSYYRNILDCIESGGPALVDGLEGRKSLELINAIYESVETRREVQLRFVPSHCKLGIQ
jgi:UDP-N-acetyl-2-amino-2-deoxyglucuronate dehydrogenase